MPRECRAKTAAPISYPLPVINMKNLDFVTNGGKNIPSRSNFRHQAKRSDS